jgi:hypothetical protein
MPSFRADLTFRQSKQVEQSKLDAERALETTLTNEEFLLLLVSSANLSTKRKA